ncbi:Protein CBG01006 [Caenorhabditis briggsae]|uniref:Protein CBG01006 n=1 Tax=Caenorhabditis briggsae TaxID=6238 RepID=A8WP45_CAEBR|nr:Protein CBG01006 [Caenorhabditis briggsae]CAP22251.2 Protein CBG01006 [Caenorhabditis briggsae]
MATEQNDQEERGALIVFEDRQSPVGEMIDRYLRGEIDMDEHALHLLFSADRFLKKKMIKQHIVVKIYGKKNEILIIIIVFRPIGLPKPDIVLFFQVSPEVAASRGGFGNERLETAQLQAEVAKVMPTLRDDAFWKSVNADAALAAVEKEVFQLYTELDRSKPLEVLEKI